MYDCGKLPKTEFPFLSESSSLEDVASTVSASPLLKRSGEGSKDLLHSLSSLA